MVFSVDVTIFKGLIQNTDFNIVQMATLTCRMHRLVTLGDDTIAHDPLRIQPHVMPVFMHLITREWLDVYS
jgi:hypothetical protein